MSDQIETARGPASNDTRQRPAAKLEGRLGVAQLVFMVVAGAAPLTVVVGILPLMINLGNGIGAPMDFIVAGVVLLLFSVGFSAMTPEVTNAGAFYTYIQKGLGRITGLGAAALATISYIFLLVAVVAYLGAAARNVVLNFTAVETPWWIWSAIGLAAIGYLGHRNVELSARVLGVLLVGEILIVAALDAAIVFRGGHSGLSAEPLTVSAFTHGALGTGVMLAIFGFVGFEATAVFRSEAKDPDRTIPRATYAAACLISVFYATSAWAIINGVGVDDSVAAATSDPEGFVPEIAKQFVGQFAHDAIQVLLVTSFFACVLTFHNVVSRDTHTLGHQRVLSRHLAAVHPSHKSPHVASLVTFVVVATSLVVLALFNLDPVVQIYTWFGTAATLGVIALMAVTSLAIVSHFRRSDRSISLWRSAIAPGLALVGLTTILVLVVGNFVSLMGGEVVAILFGVALGGTACGGALWAIYLRNRRPEVYSAIR
ncbi:APC family permease [Mycolicibacterium sp. CBMA 295]|uniref:APC family permease n=1 Tax=Mycolicibacterium sp. CBMA 295 TaxID=2606605 RepID=UPI0012DD1D6A|nr:APC family permease [Mycolicibacterium sp. CBMA 295]MUM29135.1 APC family permease [Mycolicibacterium sp. CBMA 295]